MGMVPFSGRSQCLVANGICWPLFIYTEVSRSTVLQFGKLSRFCRRFLSPSQQQKRSNYLIGMVPFSGRSRLSWPFCGCDRPSFKIWTSLYYTTTVPSGFSDQFSLTRLRSLNPRCYLYIGCPKTPSCWLLNPKWSLNPRSLNPAGTVLGAICY